MSDPWTVLGWIAVLVAGVCFVALPGLISALAFVFWIRSRRDVRMWLAEKPKRSTWRHRGELFTITVGRSSCALRGVRPDGSVFERVHDPLAIADLARSQGWRRVS